MPSDDQLARVANLEARRGTARQTLPWVTVPLPTCPNCGSPSHRRQRTELRTDDRLVLTVTCKVCGMPFHIEHVRTK
ncbi:MAG: hypothetical protein AAGI46_09140 [Planctomycetota bacterium]